MRKTLALAILALVIGVMINPVRAEAACEDDVLALINAARTEAGLKEFVLDDGLNAAAATRAKECATTFSHTRPNGKAWYTVSKRTNGENLAHAINTRQSNPENVVTAWLLSPSHRANVMRKSTTSVGIAYYYDGNDIYICCEFN